MIKYNLICKCGETFESWFSSSSEFDSLCKKKFIKCIYCESSSVKKTVITGFKVPTMVAGAFMGTFLAVIFWLAGFKYTLAGGAAIYNQLSTVLITLMAAIFLKERMNRRSWVAVALAVAGAVLVSTS